MATSLPDARRSELPRRIASAAVLGTLAIVAAWAGAGWFEAFVLAASILAVREWASLCGLGPTHAAFWGTLLGSALLVLSAAPVLGGGSTLGLAVMGLLLIGVSAFGAPRPAHLSLGTVYIAGAGFVLIMLRGASDGGFATVLWVLLVTWASDTGAFFVGRSFGGPRLAPAISPRKTWSGAIGGVAAAALVGVLAAMALGTAHPAATALAAGVLAVAGIGGDLLESSVKRRFGVKDSGHIIPGHGGILDRIDSLLLILPVAGIMRLVGWRLP